MIKHPLKKRTNHLLKNRKFVLNIILDGVALTPTTEGNAFHAAHKPIYEKISNKYLFRSLFAHGTYVGLPSDSEMGNSEVGHNAIGSGKIYSQGARLVNESIANNSIFSGGTWKNAIDFAQKLENSNESTLHFLGLISDGYVHSHLSHFYRLAEEAAKDGIKNIYLHAILDGRDVSPNSAEKYLSEVEEFLTKLNTTYKVNAKIATVTGRMVAFMDRYEADWNMVQIGWDLMIEAKTHTTSGNESNVSATFPNALAGVKHYRSKGYNNDQYIPPFIIKSDSFTYPGVKDGDAVLLFNYRGDRAIEISRAFDEEKIPHFNKTRHPKVFFAGMMQYDGDLQIPKNYLVSPPQIQETMGEYLTDKGETIFAISETQKYGHVTYFWNGNKSEKFSDQLESYFEIKSDNVPFDERPWMKAADITDLTIEQIKSGKFTFGRINYPNGDMVGHTGDFHATRMSIEATDRSLGRLLKVVEEYGGIAIVTADHGNCDEMYQLDKAGKAQKDDQGNYIAKTSHTLNPVPIIIFDPQYGQDGVYYKWAETSESKKAGIANIAATTLNLMNYEAPEDYEPSLITFTSQQH